VSESDIRGIGTLGQADTVRRAFHCDRATQESCLFARSSGFTLIEILVVVAILGAIAVVVIINIIGFVGAGRIEAANVEAHQVHEAVIAYMQSNRADSWDGVVDPSGEADICIYLYNPGNLQARYTVTGGQIVDAYAYPDGKWAGCTWNCEQCEWQLEE